jgi:membrane protein DedA with SNARE-associated domain
MDAAALATTLPGLIAMLAGQPVLAFGLIVGLTFLLEDATAVAAGALAMAGVLDPALALAALLVGTVAGDLLLHGAGRLARRHRGIAAWVARHGAVERAGRSLLTVAAARFVPGLRLPVYVGSGVARLGFWPLLLVVAATALLWTPALFWSGQAIAASGHGVALVAGFMLVLMLAPTLLKRLRPAPAPCC